ALARTDRENELNGRWRACRMRAKMDTTCLTDPKWRRMDGAVAPDPAAPEILAENPAEPPRALGWFRDHGLALGGSVLFVGGLLWLLQAGALPVVPPAGAWS